MDDCDHQWKFNGGNVFCPKCKNYRDDNPIATKLPAKKNDDGTYTIYVPGQGSST